MTTAIKAFSSKSNATRAAKATLGAAAKVDVDFTITPVDGGFAWSAIEAAKIEPVIEPQPEPAAVVEPELSTAEVTNMPTKLYDKKGDAISAARKTLGADAERGKDFRVKQTARGEWYWLRAEQPSYKVVAPKAKAENAPKAAKAERVKKPKADKADKAAGEKRPMGESMTKLISMLSRANGASVEEIIAVIPWEAHTARARISADLVNKRGYKIERTKSEKRGSVYKIVGEPAAAAA